MGEAEKVKEAGGGEEGEKEEEGAVCVDDVHGSSLPSTTEAGIS